MRNPPNAQTDYHLTLDRAAALILDAQCACRAAAAGRLPQPHRRLLISALGHLEKAQQDLFQGRNDPWHSQTPQRPKQLSML